MKLGYSKSKAMALTVAVLLSVSASGVASAEDAAEVAPVASKHQHKHESTQGELQMRDRSKMRKRPTFESLDVDADGIISFDEFSLKAKGDKAEKFFSRMDKDGDGQVTGAEFISPKPPRKGARVRDRSGSEGKQNGEHKGGHEDRKVQGDSEHSEH